jgi:hypothetical protein
LFRRFLEWLKEQASLTSTTFNYFEEVRTARCREAIEAQGGKADRGEHRQATGASPALFPGARSLPSIRTAVTANVLN